MLVALFSAGSRRRDDGTEIQALRVLEFVENVNCDVGDKSCDLDSGITHVFGYIKSVCGSTTSHPGVRHVPP